MRKEFTLAELARLVGVDVASLRNWVRAGLLAPIRMDQKCNRGPSPLFDLVGIVAAMFLRQARISGLTLAYCGPVARFLASQTAQDILEAADGDLYLFAAGDCVQPAFRRKGETIPPNASGIMEVAMEVSMRRTVDQVRRGISHFETLQAVASN